MDFKFWTEFASHEKEFDCLRSMEVEEKINVVKFVHQPTDDLTLLLTTNGLDWTCLAPELTDRQDDQAVEVGVKDHVHNTLQA